MKISLIIIIFLIEKTEMPHIRKKHPANGKSRNQVNRYHWMPRHSSFFNFHNTGIRRMRNKQKLGHKSIGSGINDKLHETFEVAEKWQQFNPIRSKDMKKHYLTSRPIRKRIIYSKPTYQHLSSIGSYFNPKFPKVTRDNIELVTSLSDTGKLRSNYLLQNYDAFSDQLKKRHKSEIGNSSHIGGMLIRSNDEDEDYEDEDDEDEDEDDYEDIESKSSKPSTTTDDSDYEEDYDDVYSQPSSFSFGNKPFVSPIFISKNNSNPLYSKFAEANSNVPVNFQAKLNNQFQQFPQFDETSGSRTVVGGINTQYQMFPAISSNLGPNNQLPQPSVLGYRKEDTFKHEFPPSFVNQSKMISVPFQMVDLNQQSAKWLQMKEKTGDFQWKTVSPILKTAALPLNSNTNMNPQFFQLAGGNPLQPPLRYPILESSGIFFQQQPLVSQANKNLTSLNTGFNSAPYQLNGLLFNQAPSNGEVKNGYPVGMDMRPEAGEDLYKQQNNVFHKPSENKLKEINILEKSREHKTKTSGFQDWIKNARSRGKGILLGALVIFCLVSFSITLAAIKYCQYSKDVMNRYPKKKTSLTFIGASKQENKNLLKRIGRIKKSC